MAARRATRQSDQGRTPRRAKVGAGIKTGDQCKDTTQKGIVVVNRSAGPRLARSTDETTMSATSTGTAAKGRVAAPGFAHPSIATSKRSDIPCTMEIWPRSR
jgi:hypothetical protein